MNMNKQITSILFGMYCGGLMIQNILAVKSIDISVFTVTTGILISPLLFIIQDISSEIFGYKQTKDMILLSFVMNFIGVILFQLAILIPASGVWDNQQAFAAVLGTTVRITAASFIAYVSGSLLNAKIMVKMKRVNESNLFIRAITSTLFGQFLDNAIFAFGAFLFIIPVPALLSMVAGGTVFEVLYEIIFYPVTKKIIKYLKNL